jgi:hypothetical protein
LCVYFGIVSVGNHSNFGVINAFENVENNRELKHWVVSLANSQWAMRGLF